MDFENQHQEPFQEAYWDDALKVLKREERRAWLAKAWPWAMSSVVLIALLMTGFLGTSEKGKLIASESELRLSSAFAMLDAAPVASLALESTTPNTTPTQKVNQARIQANSQERSTTLNSAPKTISAETDASINQTQQALQVQPPTNQAQKAIAEANPNEFATASTSETNQESKLDAQPITENVMPARSEQHASADFELNSAQPPLGSDVWLSNLERSGSFSNEPLLNRSRIQNMNAIGYKAIPASMAEFNQRSYSKKAHRQIERNARFNKLMTRKHALKMYIGAAPLAGYGTEKGLISWSPSVGLTYERKIYDRLWVTAGLGYQQINGVRYKAHFFQDELSFGYNSTRTTVATNTLYIAEIPVHLWRDISNRSSIMLGLNAEMIVNTKSDLLTDEINSSTVTPIGEDQSFGYTSGVRSLMAGARFGYRYRLNKRADISLIRQIGLQEVNNGKFYLSNGNDNNSRWNVLFSWTLK